MLDLVIVAFGRVKDKMWQAAAEEYLKRLRPYARIKIEELKAESFSAQNKIAVKKIEGQRLLEFLRNYQGTDIYLLAEAGTEMTSSEFAAWLEKPSRQIVFVVGGTLGFSSEVARAYPRLSLSRLTFPHEVARVLLLEQIYRAASIMQGKDYHY